MSENQHRSYYSICSGRFFRKSFSNSDKTKQIWTKRTGIAFPSYNDIRWYSKYEVTATQRRRREEREAREAAARAVVETEEAAAREQERIRALQAEADI